MIQLLSILVLFAGLVGAFVNDRTGPGVMECNSTTVPFSLSGAANFQMVNCLYKNCPQIQIVNSNVTVSNVTFLNEYGTEAPSLSSEGGGVFNIAVKDPSMSTFVSMNNVTFSKSVSSGNGGAIRMTGSGMTANLQNVIFYQTVTSGLSFSGAISVEGNVSLTLIGCQILETSAPAISSKDALSFSLINSLVAGNIEAGTGGGMDIQGSTMVKIQGTVFRDFNQPTMQIALINFSRMNNAVYIRDSSFSNINMPNAYYGLIVTYDVLFLTIENCNFTKVTSLSSALYLNNYYIQGNLLLKSSIFNRNFGADCADIGLYGPISISAFDSVFNSSQSQYFGSVRAYFLNSALFSNCSFNSCVTSYAAALSIEFSPINLRNCLFAGNQGQDYGAGIYYVGEFDSSIIKDCQFVNNTANSGAAIYASTSASFLAEGCVFRGNNASRGGAIHIRSGSSVNIVNSAFYQNFASDSGGAVYTYGIRNIQVQGCTFTENHGDLAGSLYLMGPGSDHALVSNSTFFSNTAKTVGGDIVIQGLMNANITLSTFQKSSVPIGAGGSFSIKNEPKVLLHNNVFKDIFAYSVGFLDSFGPAKITITNCSFENITSSSGLFLNASGSAITFINNSFSLIESPGDGSIFYALLGTLTFDKLSMNIPSRLFELATSSTIKITGPLILTGQSYPSDDSAIATLAEGSSLTLSPGSLITGYSGASLITVAEDSSLTLNGITVVNCSFTDSVLISENESKVTIVNSTFTGSILGCMDFLSTNSGSQTTILGSLISGFSFKGCGPVSIGRLSSLTIANSVIRDNYYYYGSSNLPCSKADRNNPLRGFGGAFCITGMVNLSSNVRVLNNSANYGGAFYLGPEGNLTIGSNIQVEQNCASLDGGAFYLSTGSEVSLVGSDNSIQDNRVLAEKSHSSFAYYSGENGGIIRGQAASYTNSSFNGESFVSDLFTARIIKAQINSTASFYPFPIRGRTDYLKLFGNSSSKVINLDMIQSPLPPIQVKAYDTFGNVATLERDEVVIVQLVELSNKTQLAGEDVKAISNTTSSAITFTNVEIANRLPGEYRISAIPVTTKYSTFAPSLDSDNYLLVEYKNCSSTQQLFPALNQCLDIVKINFNLKILLATISGLAILFSIRCLFHLMFKIRGLHLDRNRSVLLPCTLIGAIVSLTSPILSTLELRDSCIISLALETVGFLLLIFSLIGISALSYSELKIQRYGNDSNSIQIEKNIQQILGVAITILLSMFVASMIIFYPMTSFSTEVDLIEKTVLTDRCETMNVRVISIVSVKLLLSVVASATSFLAQRLVDSTHISNQNPFNEPQVTSLACYNMATFGSALELVTSLNMITQFDAWFTIRAISLIFTNTFSVFAVVWLKLYVNNMNQKK